VFLTEENEILRKSLDIAPFQRSFHSESIATLMGKNGLRMQKLSQKEDALCSLEKEEKSSKMGKIPL